MSEASNQKPNKKQNPLPTGNNGGSKFSTTWLYAIIVISLVGIFFMNEAKVSNKEVIWSEFEEMAKKDYFSEFVVYRNSVSATLRKDKIAEVYKSDSTKITDKATVTVLILFSSDKFMEYYGAWIEEKSTTAKLNFGEDNKFWEIFLSFAPILFLVVLFFFLMRRMSGGAGGNNPFSVGKARAQLFDKGSATKKTTFKDVAGLSEAKQEVEEIVEFLKNPSKFTDLGGKIPKGALLVGPPGTGKTLLAKAVAGEADVPFFSLSGSDFVEMFVGVGASRVRDLFRQAKEKAPCIIFIDEIDAVGRARGRNPNMGSNDERENTLNQLLTEMDGFGTNSGIIVLAATNRADILDKALLRAGRFDRQINVDLPELNDRKEIFIVHLRNIKIDDTVDTDFLARQTPGFSGADIANVCNEAALIAARGKKEFVQKEDFMNAVDRIVGGLEKKSKITTEAERKTIAIHEAGHAVLSWVLEHANPLVKVTIVPRGKALGAAWYLPEERQITTTEQLQDEMCATLGGRAAEELFTGKVSTGAANDLEKVTRQSVAMVTYFGMSEKLQNLNYYDSTGQEWGFTKPYSDQTAALIDDEVKRIINEQYERAKSLLKENEEGHSKLYQLLLEKEVIYSDDLELIFGKRQWISRTQEIFEQQEKVNAENTINTEDKETESKVE